MNPTYVFEDVPTDQWNQGPYPIALLGARAQQQLFFVRASEVQEQKNTTRIFYLEGYKLAFENVESTASPMDNA